MASMSRLHQLLLLALCLASVSNALRNVPFRLEHAIAQTTTKPFTGTLPRYLQWAQPCFCASNPDMPAAWTTVSAWSAANYAGHTFCPKFGKFALANVLERFMSVARVVNAALCKLCA